MPEILIRQRLPAKPHLPVSVDWNHWLARESVFALLGVERAGVPIALDGRKHSALNSNIAWNLDGSFSVSTSTAASYLLAYPLNTVFSSSDRWTLIGRGSINVDPTTFFPFIAGLSQGTSTSNIVGLARTTEHKLKIGSSGNTPGVGTKVLGTGVLYNYALIHKGGGMLEAWIDGIFDYSDTHTAPIEINALDSVTLSSEMVGNYVTGGTHQYAYVFPWALTAEQQKEIYADPYAPIRYRRILVPVSAGGSITKSVSDTASSTDAIANLAVALGVSDSGTGADSTAESVAFALQDSGAGADTVSLLIAVFKSISDSGVGSDVLFNIGAGLSVPDSIAGSDTLAASVALAIQDAGSGADTVSVLSEVLKSIIDSATGTDAVSNIAVSLAAQDSGAGVDSLNIAVTLAAQDSGAGADFVSVVTETLKSIADSGAGVDVVSGIAALLPISETATGTDSQTIAISVSLADAGAGVDVVSAIQQALKSVADSMLGADAAGISAGVPVSDSGAGTESTTISVTLPVSDSGAGLDATSISSLISVIDSVSGGDIVVKFDTVVKIVSIQFTVKSRKTRFTLN